MDLNKHRWEIDFDLLGRSPDQSVFAISIGVEPLAELIRHAEIGHRVYELFMLQRPGDLWAYLTVTVRALPPRIGECFRSALIRSARLVPDKITWRPGISAEFIDTLPLSVFDAFFRTYDDDMEAEDHAWIGLRDSAAMENYLNRILTAIVGVQRGLEDRDVLFSHEIARIRARTHLYDYWPEQRWREECRRFPPVAPAHTPEFYAKLEYLLSVRKAHSVAYRGVGDYFIHRLMCLEQRRRADAAQLSPRFAMYLCSLGGVSSSRPWGAELFYFSEGLGPGELFIEDHCLGHSIQSLIESGRTRCNYLLSSKDEGVIGGYHRETGNGWTAYERETPVPLSEVQLSIDMRIRPEETKTP